MHVRGPGGALGPRLAILARGTVLGELALLDGRPRSAAAIAEGPLGLWSLSVADFERLGRDHPGLARAVLAGLGREIARRLRIANRITTELQA